MQGATPGQKMVFKLDNAAGALVDLSQYSPKGAMSRTQEMYVTDTADGSGSKSVIPGLKGGQTFQIDFLYHEDLDDILGAVFDLTTGASQSYEWGPEGSTAGKPKYTGECFLVSYNHENSVGSVATMNATFQQSGAQSRTAW